MDMPLGFYARDTILRQVTEALSQHHIGRLLLVTHATDARMKLENYMLIRDDLMRSGIVFQERYFDEVFAANSIRVQWLNKKGFRIFPTGEEIWSAQRTAAHGDGQTGSAPHQRLAEHCHRSLSRHSEGESAGGETVLPLRMMKSFSQPLLGESATGETWILNANLRPVQAGKTYSVCLTGEGDDGGVQYFADMSCFYFPM